jgi:hypothetical protein
MGEASRQLHATDMVKEAAGLITEKPKNPKGSVRIDITQGLAGVGVPKRDEIFSTTRS